MFATQTGIDRFREHAIARFKRQCTADQRTELLPDQVILIYNSPATTRILSELFNIPRQTVIDIKNSRGGYATIIHNMLLKQQKLLLTGGDHVNHKVVQY